MKPVASLKHKADKRAHIPSGEEAGYEAASPKVTAAPDQRAFPRNPIVQRGQDPELFWMHKYGAEEVDGGQGTVDSGSGRPLSTNPYSLATTVDIRSLYRHEHLAPETLIKGLYRIVADKSTSQDELFSVNELFGNAIGHEELDKVTDYYKWTDGWTNRLIQGDSLLVMTSLLEREGMAGHVQCIYLDPPYGIKYGSNWQIKLNNHTVMDGQDDSLSGEPEQIKAFRDTWELGIHSYLSYLRDRLLVAKELLHESGSCFVQISDENVHLVRCLMDEVFGSGNFCAFITFRKKLMPMGSDVAEGVSDYLLWYTRDRERVKSRPIFQPKAVEGSGLWAHADFPDGTRRKLTREEIYNHKLLPAGTRVFQSISMLPAQYRKNQDFDFEFEGKSYSPPKGSCWKTDRKGMDACAAGRRLIPSGDTPPFLSP